MIKIEDLKLVFPGRLDLSIGNLSIEEGKIFTVIGPNGAGKSTLLNILALFQKPDQGSIEVFGCDIFHLKDALSYRRSISFIFSRPYLFCDTVYHNIALPLQWRGINDAKAVSAMLDLFEIGPLKDANAGTLSQGQMHRVALARALVTRPKLLLLDEPFLSLDPRYKETLVGSLRRIIHSEGTTVIFVTQDHVEALRLADDLTIMKDGALLQRGKPQDLFTKPASREVADFVGIDSIIEGIIAKKEGDLCFVRAGATTLEAVSEYDAGDSVFVCIRPEDVIISLFGGSSGAAFETSSARNHFKARIIHLEPWKLEIKLTLDCGFNLSAVVTRQSKETLGLKIGQEIFVSFKATAIHLIKR